MSPKKPSVQFVDELLGSLGLNSVTTVPANQKTDDVQDWSQTGVYGRARYSTKNREVLLEALEREPAPRTLAELHARMSSLGEERQSEEISAILAAVQSKLDEDVEITLDQLVNDGPKTEGP